MKKILSVALLLSGFGSMQIHAYTQTIRNLTPGTVAIQAPFKGCSTESRTVASGASVRVDKGVCLMEGVRANGGTTPTTNTPPAWTPKNWKDTSPGTAVATKVVPWTETGAQTGTWVITGPYVNNKLLYSDEQKTNGTNGWDLNAAEPATTGIPYVYKAGEGEFRILSQTAYSNRK